LALFTGLAQGLYFNPLSWCLPSVGQRDAFQFSCRTGLQSISQKCLGVLHPAPVKVGGAGCGACYMILLLASLMCYKHRHPKLGTLQSCVFYPMRALHQYLFIA